MNRAPFEIAAVAKYQLIEILNRQGEDAKSDRGGKRDGGEGKPHGLLPFPH
jgi:hypothetical protein